MTDPNTDPRTDAARMRAILILAATFAFVSAPLWSSGFGGFDPNAFPVPLDNPVTQPSGYVFSIWGVVYLWLLISAGFGLLARADDAGWDASRWWLIASLAIGTPWISVAMLSPVWATVMILAMLLTALKALWLTPLKDRWLLRLPVSLYAGWLTAATGVSISILLTGYGLASVSVLGLVPALLLGLYVQLSIAGAPLYGVAVAWGLLGIVTKNLDTGYLMLAILALVMAVVFLVTAFVSERRGAAT